MLAKFSSNHVGEGGYIERMPNQTDLDALDYGIALPSSKVFSQIPNNN